MSRVAKKPIKLPPNVTATINGGKISVKGPKGSLERQINGKGIKVEIKDNVITFALNDQHAANDNILSGTLRADVSNMVEGVSKGFEKKLELVGVGYRAQVQGKLLNLTLGFSHPVQFDIPADITIETPSQTEVIVKGPNRQSVGLVAATLRGIRPPEPYKGKGVKYADERIILKETKKK